MVSPLPLPPPTVQLMEQSGKPTQHGREFLERLEKLVRTLNSAAAAAPATAQYVTLATDATLTVERVLTAGTNVSFVDGGAGGALTVNVAGVSAGASLQTLQNTYDVNANLSTTISGTDTVPTISDGTQVLAQAITTAASANKVLVSGSVWGAVATNSVYLIAALFRGTTCINVAAHLFPTAGFAAGIKFDFLDSPGSAAAHTYSVRVGASSGNARLNGNHATRLFGGASKCTLTVTEIKG